MAARTTCTHGITPKRSCRECRNEYAKMRSRLTYDPARNRAKYLANRERQIVRNMNAYAKRKGYPGTVSFTYWASICNRPCTYCGLTGFPMHMDHRVALSRGGSNTNDNIQPLCQFCNRAKQDLSEEEFLAWLRQVQRSGCQGQGGTDMSRSRRHTPVTGITTAESEKWDKRHANRVLRHRVKAAIRSEAETLPQLREVSNVWSFMKDGKMRFAPGDYRFDKLMRK